MTPPGSLFFCGYRTDELNILPHKNVAHKEPPKCKPLREEYIPPFYFLAPARIEQPDSQRCAELHQVLNHFANHGHRALFAPHPDVLVAACFQEQLLKAVELQSLGIYIVIHQCIRHIIYRIVDGLYGKIDLFIIAAESKLVVEATSL